MSEHFVGTIGIGGLICLGLSSAAMLMNSAAVALPPEIISGITGFGSGLAVLWIGTSYIKQRDQIFVGVLRELNTTMNKNTVQTSKLDMTISAGTHSIEALREEIRTLKEIEKSKRGS